jgi:hypothetical protein
VHASIKATTLPKSTYSRGLDEICFAFILFSVELSKARHARVYEKQFSRKSFCGCCTTTYVAASVHLMATRLECFRMIEGSLVIQTQLNLPSLSGNPRRTPSRARYEIVRQLRCGICQKMVSTNLGRLRQSRHSLDLQVERFCSMID